MRIDAIARLPDDARRASWIALLIAAGVLLSWALACATPFAALAALAAVNMGRRDGRIVIVASWLVNQAIGFCVLAYPWDASTLAWGAAIGVAALLALFSAEATAARLDGANALMRGAAAFLAAFVAYEAALYVATFLLGGADEAFAWTAVRDVFTIDAASFVALLVLHRVALLVGLAARRPEARLATPA